MIDPSSSEEESDEEQTGRGPPKGGLRQQAGGTPQRHQPHGHHGSASTPKTIIANANSSMSSGIGPSLHSGSTSSGLNRHGSSHSSKHSMAEQYHSSGPATPAHHGGGGGGGGGHPKESYQQNHHGMSHAGSDTSGSLDVPSSTIPR